MQDGNPGQDPVCGRCKQKIEMAVRTEAVYQDGIWFHTACHQAGADQLLRGPRSPDRPHYAFRGGLSGAGASSTASSIAANIERGF
jgi:hypothetical protein